MPRALLWEPPIPAKSVGVSSEPLPCGLNVIPGDSAGGALRQAGGEPLLIAPDTLTVGPSFPDAARHARGRALYWKNIYRAAGWDWSAPSEAQFWSGLHMARATKRCASRPVVLWVSGDWRGLLFLSWAEDALHRASGLSLHAALFPRRASRGRPGLRLLAFDEALLTSLSRQEWRSFPDLVRGDFKHCRPGAGVFGAICHYGEAFIQARLSQWSVTPFPAVEASKVEGGPYRSTFRLNALGASLVAGAISDLAVIPRIQVGGFDSERSEPWVCEVNGASWALKPLRTRGKVRSPSTTRPRGGMGPRMQRIAAARR
jgi:hypothetical protein